MLDFDDFIELVYSIKDRALLEDFLLGVTTSKERQELSQRIKIIKLLLAGVAQQKIASDLGVGVATVSRGSKELAQGRFKIFSNQQ